jgi:hypothetical protein
MAEARTTSVADPLRAGAQRSVGRGAIPRQERYVALCSFVCNRDAKAENMTDRTTARSRRTRPLGGTLQQSSGPTVSTVIGFAHVARGAVGVLGLAVTLAFNRPTSMADGVVALLLLALSSVGLVVAGLWLADGRKRGAVLAVGLDVVSIALLLFGGRIASLDFGISLALGAAALWVLPQLELPSLPRPE